jgi:hypothetical protein
VQLVIAGMPASSVFPLGRIATAWKPWPKHSGASSRAKQHAEAIRHLIEALPIPETVAALSDPS